MAAQHQKCTRRNRISLIKQNVINGRYKFCCPGPDDSSVCVCECVCMHVCDQLHYTSPIGPSQGPRHSSVPWHKASWWNCLLLTIRRTRSPLKQHPGGRAPWGAEHVDTHCLNPHAEQQRKQGHRFTLQQLSMIYVCMWMYLCVWVWERERTFPLWNSVICVITQGLSHNYMKDIYSF